MPQKRRPVEFQDERPKKRENPRTTQMGSFHAPRAVLYDPRLSHPTLRVACWLYDHLRPGDHAATGAIATIAADLAMSRTTVLRSLAQLRQYRIILSVGQELNNHKVPYNEYRMRVYDEAPKRLTLVKAAKKSPAPVTASPVKKALPRVGSDKTWPPTLYGKCGACAGRGVVLSGRPPKQIPCPLCAGSV